MTANDPDGSPRVTHVPLEMIPQRIRKHLKSNSPD